MECMYVCMYIYIGEARDGLAPAVCGGRVYVSGGMDERDMDLGTV